MNNGGFDWSIQFCWKQGFGRTGLVLADNSGSMIPRQAPRQ